MMKWSFGKYFKSTREKLYFKLSEEQILITVAESFYIFSVRRDEVEKYVELMRPSSSNNCICLFNIKSLNFFDPELQLINAKGIIKNKIKELLSELKNLKVQSMLVLKCKARNYHKIFHSSSKQIASDSDID